jgi:hypothetical protein
LDLVAIWSKVSAASWFQTRHVLAVQSFQTNGRLIAALLAKPPVVKRPAAFVSRPR